MPQIEISSSIEMGFLIFFFGCLYNLSCSFFFGSILDDLVSEKMRGITDVLSVLGVSSVSFWGHWLVTHLIIAVIQALGIGGMYYANYLAMKSDYLLVFLMVLMFLLVHTAILLGNHRLYVLSINPHQQREHLQRSRFHDLVHHRHRPTPHLLGLLYLPVYLAEPPGYVKGILTIIPSLGAIESFIHLSQLEGMGTGLTTATLSSGDYPMGILFIVQFVCSLIWFCLCWYFSALFPPGSADGKSWYFIFQPSFWCRDTSKISSKELRECFPNYF